MTPHNEAKIGDFSEKVLMSGDPLRIEFIAKNFLVEAKKINGIRNNFAFTGFYKGEKISLMAHGMGIPSAAIYITELIKVYGVKKIIRAGTAGGIGDCDLGDLIAVNCAATDSNFIRNHFYGFDYAPSADFELLSQIKSSAEKNNKKIKIGKIFTTDSFYQEDSQDLHHKLARKNILAVEMEIAALYALGEMNKIQSAAICTISDHLLKKGELSAKEREEGLEDMIEIAIEALRF